MDEIKNDADALGASLMAPFMMIVGIVSASLIIYCIITCVKNRRKQQLVAVIYGKGNLVLADYAKRTETQMNYGHNNHSLENEMCSSSNTDEESDQVKKVGCYPQSLVKAQGYNASRQLQHFYH